MITNFIIIIQVEKVIKNILLTILNLKLKIKLFFIFYFYFYFLEIISTSQLLKKEVDLLMKQEI